QNFMVNVFSVSVSAQIATLPLVIYYFHQYSFISIIANLVIIPFSEIVIIFSLVMTLLISASIHFWWLDFVYDWVVTATLKLIHFFADLDFAFYKMIPMTLLEVFVALLIVWFLRFAVLKFNIKNVSRVAYFVLTFVALRFLLNFKANEMDEILEHQYFKEKIISVKNESKVQFILKENSNPEKIEKYVIEPYLTSRRTKNFEIKKIPNEVEKVEINGSNYRLK
ncbi:ComEC/Rec2 family competence protein, partial [Kaistella sp.]|uniref:ComEC/Rec2 family competence protein n=1 Tax=Kaistella sp. TaxID=2782235 RepID=UPI003C548EA3